MRLVRPPRAQPFFLGVNVKLSHRAGEKYTERIKKIARNQRITDVFLTFNEDKLLVLSF